MRSGWPGSASSRPRPAPGAATSRSCSPPVFVEAPVQHAAQVVPGLIGTLGFAYLTLHLSVSGGLLIWLHRRRPAAYPFIRTTLLLATALAVIGYIVFPTAPPRLSGV